MLYQAYASPTSLTEALRWKSDLGARSRVCAGGTDLLLELERNPQSDLTLLDLTRIPGLAEITENTDGTFTLGPLVTHNQCVAHSGLRSRAFPLVRACWEVGSPPLRNRATIVGNLVSASPANDTIVPLTIMGAEVTVTSLRGGDRTLPLEEFITGYRSTVLAPDELVTNIRLRGLSDFERGTFIKLGLRHAQAISVVSVAVVAATADGSADFPLTDLRISLGAVDATIIRAHAAEAFGQDHLLDEATISQIGTLAAGAASPRDDVRGHADYRSAMISTLVQRALTSLATGRERAGWADKQVMLWGRDKGTYPSAGKTLKEPLEASVNGEQVALAPGQILLHSLRAAGCHEVKEGCAEGECGSCTVFLDDKAVLSCMIPAERAAGCTVETAAGMPEKGQLSTLQQAFVECGSVQCGYCIPGFIMSGTKLLQEIPEPTLAQVQEAYMGNLCRCTGYAKILEATLAAAGGTEG